MAAYAGYTKLFNSILHSTIWCEVNEVKILWITMLAMCDRDGIVSAAVPGLAKTAGITIDQTLAGLDKFLSPDKFSRTPDFEGRRIETIPGGWRLINHDHYRRLMSVEERREYNRLAQQKSRERKKELALSNNVNNVSNVKDKSAMSAHTDTDTDTDTDTAQQIHMPVGASENDEVKALKLDKEPTPEEIYDAYPRKTAKKQAIKAIRKVLETGEICPHDLLGAVQAFALSRKGRGQYCPYPATFFNQGRYDDDRQEWERGQGSDKPANFAGYTSPEQSKDVSELYRRSAAKDAARNGASGPSVPDGVPY